MRPKLNKNKTMLICSSIDLLRFQFRGIPSVDTNSRILVQSAAPDSVTMEQIINFNKTTLFVPLPKKNCEKIILPM
jgi:hypothetical protein